MSVLVHVYAQVCVCARVHACTCTSGVCLRNSTVSQPVFVHTCMYLFTHACIDTLAPACSNPNRLCKGNFTCAEGYTGRMCRCVCVCACVHAHVCVTVGAGVGMGVHTRVCGGVDGGAGEWDEEL